MLYPPAAALKEMYQNKYIASPKINSCFWRFPMAKASILHPQKSIRVSEGFTWPKQVYCIHKNQFVFLKVSKGQSKYIASTKISSCFWRFQMAKSQNLCSILPVYYSKEQTWLTKNLELRKLTLCICKLIPGVRSYSCKTSSKRNPD